MPDFRYLQFFLLQSSKVPEGSSWAARPWTVPRMPKFILSLAPAAFHSYQRKWRSLLEACQCSQFAQL
jgi:hypothetical protein